MLGNETDAEQLQQWKIDADAGDQHAQLLLGQHYLKLAQMDADPQSNANLAVSFLINSSKQGNEEATKLLLDCLSKELGQYLTNFTWCM